MPFSIDYTQSSGLSFSITLGPGNVLFVVGANGTGKSSLLQRFFQQTRPNSRRISAHRQTWFTSNTLDLTPQSRRSTESNIANSDSSYQARYMDTYASQRASMTVFDLIDAQNVRARIIAAAVDANNIEAAKVKSLEEAHLKTINSLLALSNIPIEIDVIENEQIVARKNGGVPYSIAELSDGERNALLIAGDVLTAKPGSLLIIDEPERHLHRSIISPLLTSLFEKRKDCSFVIATHDVDLPLDNENARTLLVRSAVYQGPNVLSWDADLLEPGNDLDEDVKRDVIGSRRRILFVEGSDDSLDKPFFSIIFPIVSVIAKESCKGVEQSVAGLRAADSLAWVRAWGIVDGDSQGAARIDELASRHIYAVPYYSVESIYYHPYIIGRVAERQAIVTAADANEKKERAIDVGISWVRRCKMRMVVKSAAKAARDRVLMHLPTVPSVTAGSPVSISIDTASLLAAKEAELEQRLNCRDWASVVATCPIRESGALEPISKAVGLPGVKDYEAAVRTLLIADAAALQFVRGLFAGAWGAVAMHSA